MPLFLRKPTERNIRKDIKKSLGTKQNFFSRHLGKLIAIIMVAFVFSLLLFSELFLHIFSTPSIQGRFIIDSCVLDAFSECDLQIYGDTATFTYASRNNKLVDIKFEGCQSFELQQGKVELSGCDFSSFSNRAELSVIYQNQESGLIHQEKAIITKNFEITKLVYFSGRAIDKAKELIVPKTEQG